MGSIAGSGSIMPLIILILAVIICLFLMRKYWIKKKGNDDVRICSNCRQPVESDSAYCENCGAKIPAATEAAGKCIGNLFKKKRKIIISAVCAICAIIIAFVIFIVSHQWRWDATGYENIYGIGAYYSHRGSEEICGLYRYRWYGYEDLTNGYYFDKVRVTDQYIAIKTRGKWYISTPDYKNDFNAISSPSQDLLTEKTGMLWTEHPNSGKWGIINVVYGQDYSVDFIYDDVLPHYEFDKDGANIICKKDGLWGMLHIPYATGSKITEYVPFIFHNPEHIKNVEIVNHYYTVTTNTAVSNNPQINERGYIIVDTIRSFAHEGNGLPIRFIYDSTAFYTNGGNLTLWHCVDLSDLEKDSSY